MRSKGCALGVEPLHSKGHVRADENMASTQGSAERRRNRILSLLIVLAMSSLGVWLDLARPVWLRPPLLAYTPALYSLLPLAWLPALAICAKFRLINGRLFLLLISVGLLMGNCFWFTLTAPRTTPELPYLGAKGELSCYSTTLS